MGLVIILYAIMLIIPIIIIVGAVDAILIRRDQKYTMKRLDNQIKELQGSLNAIKEKLEITDETAVNEPKNTEKSKEDDTQESTENKTE